MKSLVFFLFSFALQATPYELAKEYQRLSDDLFERYIHKEDSLLLGHHYVLKSCQSFPYYRSINPPTEGHPLMAKNLKDSLATVSRCLEKRDFKKPVLKTLSRLAEIIGSQQTKTLTCNYGVTNSFFAVASDEEQGAHQDHGLPPHPSVIFDTNRIAGNWHLGMDEEGRQNAYNFYGGRIPLEDIISGMPHPLRKPNQNPSSLIFHEMTHWTGEKHFPKDHLDSVYLIQFCCFSHPQIPQEAREFSCRLLEDEQAWAPEEKERVEYLKKEEFFKKVKALKDLYHHQ